MTVCRCAGCIKAAAVLLQAAIDRATSHCVKIKLHNEWDSIALEERVHPVPLAGQASRDYMEVNPLHCGGVSVA